jgi:hypothetical protein
MIQKPIPDIAEEAQRIVDNAEKQNVVLRLFGGMAIRFHCPSANHRGLQRKYADIDFMGLTSQSKQIKKLFPDLGYTPRDIFNAMQGRRRLVFNDLENERRVDIFLDVFEMCHKLEFKDRLSLDSPTIPLADLLATKLQVVEITDREYRDIIALVHDHELGDSDAHEMINVSYLAKLCAEDWGMYKTFSINIATILSGVGNFELSAESRELVKKRLEGLRSRIENAPKSVGWKMRAKIGEKKRWYEVPEADKEIINSQVFNTPN